jgi:hypothetical protein
MSGWYGTDGIWHPGSFDDEGLPGPPRWYDDDPEAIAVAAVAVVRARRAADTEPVQSLDIIRAVPFGTPDEPISNAKGMSLLARAVRSRLRKGGR